MTNSELQEIKDRLECPECGSDNVDIYFINESSEEVSFTLAIESQELDEYCHICECKSCGNEDDRCFFDYVEYNKWKITMHQFVQRKSLKEHSEVIY